MINTAVNVLYIGTLDTQFIVHNTYNLVQSTEIETICVVCLFWLDENHLFCLIFYRMGRTGDGGVSRERVMMKWKIFNFSLSFFSVYSSDWYVHTIYTYMRNVLVLNLEFTFVYLSFFVYERIIYTATTHYEWKKIKEMIRKKNSKMQYDVKQHEFF